MTEDGVRLNKFIAETGLASRRAADRMIEEGRVTVNGRKGILGDRIGPRDEIRVDGQPIRKDGARTIILAFNKPRGLTCTSDKRDDSNVIDYIGYPRRIITIGRLDKDSEGLLLLTSDGGLADKIMRSRYGHEKEYVVTVDNKVTEQFLRGMERGVEIEEGVVTRKCKTEIIDPSTFRIILKQGLNRQIRRMCEHFGYRVKRLVRVRVMNIELGNLKSGCCRDISRRERKGLMAVLDMSELEKKA